MRVIHVELDTPLVDENNCFGSGLFGSAVPRCRISTEVIVADDADVRAAGREAREAIDEFITGYGEEKS